MDWWEFGEHSGFLGEELALHRVTCGFCGSEGNFEKVHHLEKVNEANRKKLNYDIFKCGNCGNFTMVFWSASRFGGGRGMHNFRTLPWRQETTQFPEHWPSDVGRYWLQARRSLEGKNWDAAALMARSAIQLIARYQKAVGSNLKREIEDLGSKGVLPPALREWSHEVRELGNDSAHPAPGEKGTAQKDAQDVVEFLSTLLTVTYDLPHQIKQYRARKKS
jgi:Domain of unknown function (DUF4145)